MMHWNCSAVLVKLSTKYEDNCSYMDVLVVDHGGSSSNCASSYHAISMVVLKRTHI